MATLRLPSFRSSGANGSGKGPGFVPPPPPGPPPGPTSTTSGGRLRALRRKAPPQLAAADNVGALTALIVEKDTAKPALIPLLVAVMDEAETAGWADRVEEELIDALLGDLLPRLGDNARDREALSLVHCIACHALELGDQRRKRKSVAEKAQLPREERWLNHLVDMEATQRTRDAPRRAAAMRTLGVLAESRLGPFGRKRVVEAVIALLAENAVRASAPLALAGPKGSTVDQDATMLTEAALSAARRTLPEGLAVLEEAGACLCATRGDVARLAMAVMFAALRSDREAVAREVAVRLPLAPQGGIDVSSPMAARDLAGICAKLSTSARDNFFSALALMLRDERPAVYLHAAGLLAKCPWAWLAGHLLPPLASEHKTERERRQGAGIRLIPELLYRLAEALGDARSTVFVAACATLCDLGRVRSDAFPDEDDADPLHPLSGKVATRGKDASLVVRSAAARALVWTAKPAGLPAKLADIALEHPHDVGACVHALVQRSARQPKRVVPVLLEHVWHCRDKLDPEEAYTSWRVAAASHAAKTFHLVLSLLDWARTTDWQVSCAMFLGIHAHRLRAMPDHWARAALLRLERTACVASAWMARREAALALVRLALMSREPARFEAYEALACLGTESQLGVADIVDPALRLLDEVYGALGDGGSALASNAKLVAKARVLCGGAMPSGFVFFADGSGGGDDAAVSPSSHGGFSPRAAVAGRIDEDDDGERRA